jgi:hypothetical protein
VPNLQIVTAGSKNRELSLSDSIYSLSWSMLLKEEVLNSYTTKPAQVPHKQERDSIFIAAIFCFTCQIYTLVLVIKYVYSKVDYNGDHSYVLLVRIIMSIFFHYKNVTTIE